MAGYTEKKPALLARLRRIEGQVRGVERMVSEDVYCIDVLTQISAATRVSAERRARALERSSRSLRAGRDQGER